MPVEPADADHYGWQGQDLWIAGDDGRLLQPARGYGESISIGERVLRFDPGCLEHQRFASRYDVDRKRLHLAEAILGLRLTGELEQAIEDLAKVDHVQKQAEVATLSATE